MRVADESLLSDDLLRQLVAAGHVDILVGMPTLNNATTVVDVVRGGAGRHRRLLPARARVIFNADSGSDDGTPALVRDATTDDTGTVSASKPLRTTHRITTPYHGLPGKGSALRMIFAVADLLSADAVVALDPDVTSVTPDWIPALVGPVRDGRGRLVAPLYPARGGRRRRSSRSSCVRSCAPPTAGAPGAADGGVRLFAAVCQSLSRASGVGQRRHLPTAWTCGWRPKRWPTASGPRRRRWGRACSRRRASGRVCPMCSSR